MEKYLAALLFCISSATYSQGVLTSVPVICTNLEELADALEKFNEIPILTSMSYRNSSEGNSYEFPSVIFANTKTGTYTIAEQVNDMYCVVSIGENLKPYVDDPEEMPRKGT